MSATDEENGSVGTYDVMETHHGFAKPTTFTITTQHDLTFKMLDDGKYSVLPLQEVRLYQHAAYNPKVETGNTTGTFFKTHEEKAYANACKVYGCKIMSATVTIGECRGINEIQQTQSGTAVTTEMETPQAELEYGVDRTGAIDTIYYKKSEMYNYLTSAGTLPEVDLTTQYALDGVAIPASGAMTARLFSERGVLQGPEHKSWTSTPDTSRWYTWDTVKAGVLMPYYNKGYEPTLPADGLDKELFNHQWGLAGVYFRVKQLSPQIKTSIRCKMTTKMTVLVKPSLSGLFQNKPKDLWGLPEIDDVLTSRPIIHMPPGK